MKSLEVRYSCTRGVISEAEYAQAISISMQPPMHVLFTKNVSVE